MRLAACLVALVLGCSSSAPVDIDRDSGTTWTRDTFTPAEDVELDTTTPPVDTGSEDTAVDSAPPDTTPPPADTAPPPDACVPATPLLACLTSVPLSSACGTRPNGCGGSVTCDACPSTRKCVSSPSTDVGHCGCKPVPGPLCLDKSDTYVSKWECAADDMPLHPLAKFVPQPNGLISWWCIPAG